MAQTKPKFNTDLKLNKFFYAKWQSRWNNYIDNKLFLIKPKLGKWKPVFKKIWKEQITIFQLLISHKTYELLNQGEQAQCIACQTSNSVKYFLIECGDMALMRQHFFNTNNMKGLPENVKMDDILLLLE